ncbi:nose resistant to fluoxetine protein 6 [Drosophila ficusphila]|uniref:nose resistant to fluoxetine protein 6 n=1 Tax=Drosophila ficusphila TaxID=30025 RepID=UPI0007E64492|nr:nose resistant to fluoxetine protein 6 [Drosophila ficusphila]
MVNPRLVNLLLLLSLALASASVSWEPPQETSLDLHGLESYQSATRIRRLAVEFFDRYQNITIFDLIEPENRASAQDLQCLADLQILMKDVATTKVWALKMIDSWGSLPSGILTGNLIDLGNYDECMGVDHAVTTSHSIRGKYCLARFRLAPSISPYLSLLPAVCFPSSCSTSHMDTLLRKLFQNLLNITLDPDVPLVREKTCKTAEREAFDGLTIFTIVVLSILLGLVVLATLYDYFACQDKANINVWIKAFSARANCRVLFRLVEPKSNPNVIDCLHGIRCLSFIWVVFGHVYLVMAFSPNMNFPKLNQWTRSVYSMIIQHAEFSVDTFFFLSGLLLVVIALRAMERTKGKLNIPLMYLHRYLRLTPLLALAILVYMKILPLMGDGPLSGKVTFDDYAVCEKTWYWTLLYVQNYATHDICLGHSWYLAVDMQLYVIAPLLLIALFKWQRKAAAGIFVLLLLLASCLFSMMVIKDISLIAHTNDAMYKIYFSTQTRASPYLVGILFGYFLHENSGKQFKLSPITVILGWLVALALLFCCLFSMFDYSATTEPPPILEEAFYLTLGRIAWPLGLCWVVFACMQGYGGMANSFLSSPLWQPMSKLSYSAYIFHMFMETLNAGLTRTNTYFGNYQVMLRFWGDFGFTLLLAFVAYILMEAPLGNLESLLLPAKKPSPPAPKAELSLESKMPLPK